MKGELSHAQMEDLLHSQVLGRIAAHADDTIYMVPISYAYDNGYIYVHCDEGMLINILRKNPDTCFEVDNIKDLGNWASVVLWGNFEELKENQQRNGALRKLKDRALPPGASATTQLSPDWPFSDDLSTIRGVVFRIPVKSMTGRFESSDEEFAH